MPLLATALMLLASGRCLAFDDSPYLGIYCATWLSYGVDGASVVYGSQSDLNFDVALINEEGGRELFVPGFPEKTFKISLSRDDRPVPDGDLEVVWAPGSTYLSADYDEEPVTDRRGLLDPAGRFEARLTLAPTGGGPFPPGRYALVLRVVPETVLVRRNEPYSGRGGIGGAFFEIWPIETAEDEARAGLQQAHKARKLGDLDAAVGILSDLVDRFPRHKGVLGSLSQLLQMLGDLEGAITFLELAMPPVGEPGESFAPQTLARLYLQQGREEDAMAVLRRYYGEEWAERQMELVRRSLERTTGGGD